MKHQRLISRCIALLTAAALAGGVASDLLAQSLDSDSVELSGQDFFKAYTSMDGSMREKARLYLLGVQDTTEGKAWCSYKRLKTVTLQEAVYENFKKLSPERLNERAASLIVEILAKKFPCGGSS